MTDRETRKYRFGYAGGAVRYIKLRTNTAGKYMFLPLLNPLMGYVVRDVYKK